MNDWISIALTALLGGGLITAAVNFLKYLRERKKNTADAAEAGIIAPVEAESIQIKSMALAIQSLSEENVRINRRLGEADKERDEDRADRAQMHREISGLRKALQAAQDYIEEWIAWGHRVAPDEPQPDPPKNYRKY